MKAFFLDIGCGTSGVLLLGQGRAIVIDCGVKTKLLLQLLKSLSVTQLVALVVSHNHQDHVGGAAAVLSEYEGMIDRVCFLADGHLYRSAFWSRVTQQLKDGTLSEAQMIRLECGDRPKKLYEGATVSLKIMAPNFHDNLIANEVHNPNATSGVIIMTHDAGKIVYAGDSTIQQWRRIRERAGRPIDCEILAVPHHGGTIGDAPGDLDWLYSEGIRARDAVISVPTINA